MAEGSRTARPGTLAVVVSAGVSTYLPRTLDGIAGQHHVPETVLIVDVGAVGREVGTGVPMHQAVEDAGLDSRTRVRVVSAPEAENFGQAVRLGLEKYQALLQRAARRARGHEGGTGARTRGAVSTGWRTGEMPAVTTGEIRTASPGDDAAWLWLLHDDSAPHPAALDQLLHAAESGRSVAIAGAKQRGWARPDRLLQVGLRATRSARRVLDVEPDEIDQGQHDTREDVLAVGLAGALVRRDVWEELGGPDPLLGPFGDGLDLCRRARLAGHRVVVVPTAWVHHARASYFGLRGAGTDPTAERVPDVRQSYGERRRAQLYNWLTFAPTLLLPFLLVWLLPLGLLRAVGRVATNDLALAGAELSAVPAVWAQLPAIRDARRRARETRRVSRRALRPLQATGGQIFRMHREHRRQQAAARRAAEAPSELELAERAALARRRRVALGVVGLLLVVVAVAAFGPLVYAGPLTGGALLPADASFTELWRAARSGWVPGGLGHPGPADPLLSVLALPVSVLGLFGFSTNVLLTALVVAAVPLAGVSAWFAAGAATRSVLLRAWAALVWALAPALLVSTGQGRLGAVVAHLSLPWVALGVARAVGVNRHDTILSGLVGAKRVVVLEPPADAGAPQSSADAGGPPQPAGTGGPQQPAGAETAAPQHGAGPGGSRASETPHPTSPPATSADVPTVPQAGAAPRTSRGSLTAAAAAGLALAVAAAGAPVLLPVAVVVLVVLALVVPRHRRRLLLVPLPAAAVVGPLVAAGPGWRALLGEPGAAYAADAAPAWQHLLGWPVPAPTVLPDVAVPVLLLLGGAALVLGATLALVRPGPRARAVRTGWAVAVIGLLTAALLARLAVAVGPGLEVGTDQLVRAWAGPALSVLTLGLLVAATVGGDGLRGWLTATTFGWRQLTAGVLGLTMLAGLGVSTVTWLTQSRQGYDAPTALLTVHGRPATPVPALATELQRGEQRSRVLALRPHEGTVHAEVWRAAGPQLTGTAAAVAARDLTGPPGQPQVRDLDAADADLAQTVAVLTGSTGTDLGQALGEYAIGVVLVPPLPEYVPAGTAASTAARTALIARLDATAGLERVTENDAGVIWRVSRDPAQDAAAESVARARVLGPDGRWLTDLPAGQVGVSTAVDEGPEGRTVVLAERADAGWRAWVDGRPLRAVTAEWRQAFELPTDGGHLTITYDPPWRAVWNTVQIVVLALTALLALPLRRRREVG